MTILVTGTPEKFLFLILAAENDASKHDSHLGVNLSSEDPRRTATAGFILRAKFQAEMLKQYTKEQRRKDIRYPSQRAKVPRELAGLGSTLSF